MPSNAPSREAFIATLHRDPSSLTSHALHVLAPFAHAVSSQLAEESELKWDCGDAYPEPALDEVPARIVGRNEAGLMLGGALGIMAGVYEFAKWVDKPATQPFADKTFPFEGLKAELGK